eukprot:2478704-Pleurochrysis_carterae.AAC.6
MTIVQRTKVATSCCKGKGIVCGCRSSLPLPQLACARVRLSPQNTYGMSQVACQQSPRLLQQHRDGPDHAEGGSEAKHAAHTHSATPRVRRVLPTARRRLACRTHY